MHDMHFLNLEFCNDTTCIIIVENMIGELLSWRIVPFRKGIAKEN